MSNEFENKAMQEFENPIWGVIFKHLTPETIRFIKERFSDVLLAKLEERDEKWKIAINYNCEPEQIGRILEAVKALIAGFSK